MTEFRVPAGGRVDRDQPLRFVFNGVTYTGFAGDTLASALLANGIHHVADSIKYGRPRGIMAAGIDEPTALVQIEAPYSEPVRTATTVELVDGLVARGLDGLGRLPAGPDLARYDAMHAHCELLVVGAGPAGLAAALTGARAGARVILVDDQPEAGGSLLGRPDALDRRPNSIWVRNTVSALLAHPEVHVLERATAFGRYDDGFVLAVQRRTDHLVGPPTDRARHRIWRIRATQIVLATGAYERPIVFSDNDRPGIMLAGAARTYLNRYGVTVGHRAVVFTTNDSAYATAIELADAGVDIAAVVDSRARISSRWAARLTHRGIPAYSGHVVAGTGGADRIENVVIEPTPELDHRRIIDCDTLLMSGGWDAATQLLDQSHGPSRGVRLAGSAAGQFSLGAVLRDGVAVAQEALAEAGIASSPAPLPIVERPLDEAPPETLVRVPGTGWQFVDRQRDATVSDILRATGAGLVSVEHVKRYTTIGTAHDQGRTSGLVAAEIIAKASGQPPSGTTTSRPPLIPVSFAALAGRDTGVRHDPMRITAIHSWHVEQDALFENVGQWKRAWYYPQAGENLEAAVLRECAAARTGVALMDGSTLGKIDVQGRDAGVFLDLLYTNLMSTLKVGSARYGVMCGVDGMVIDDGTVIRVNERRYLLTTTTGNAAMVLDWMEEWLQTEWPHLAVTLTSVTEHWVTIPLVGPRSRDVLAAVAPELDVSVDGFPFMTWRDTTVAGVAARVCRISFSGELAYEINVPAWYGRAVWEALIDAGEKFGITPYGTETMHVLRAEKGYPIIGQDTDGTVTPHDLGLEWAVSKKKPDFIGKRSFDRPENRRADRKQLVGLLPLDPQHLLAEGAQLVDSRDQAEPPIAMLGHVTSSYRSAALGRTFALALLRSGRERIGSTLQTWHNGELTPVTVAAPVLYDPEGRRRDG